MVAYAFGDVLVDAAARRVTRHGSIVDVPERHLDVLIELLAHAGGVVSKQALIDAGWKDVAVTDNSLEQAISFLRRSLGEGADGRPLIQTVPRQGYRFAAVVQKTTSRLSDADLDALLQPHRAWIEGRAALETLEGDRIRRARQTFELVLKSAPDQALSHVGLANACVMQFEMTRADAPPDIASLEAAARHAREACRLAPESGEAWATLGFVLDRTGHREDALAASRRATMLEPDNWRHHLRLGYVGWGEERLRAAHRTTALLPGFPLAHWLAATVHVARQAFDEAERQLRIGLEPHEIAVVEPKFSAVALHWLQGLLFAARGDTHAAHESFEREVALEASGHLYARECGAQARYALGALAWHAGDRRLAITTFRDVLERLRGHACARAALAAIDPARGDQERSLETPATSVDDAVAKGVWRVTASRSEEAAALIDRALAEARPGNAGWLLPVEPMLRVWVQPDLWRPVLNRLRSRAA